MKLGFFIFMLLPLAGQFYVSWRVWHMLPAPTFVKVIAVVVMALALACLVLNFVLPREHMPLWACQALYEVGTSWIIIILYMFMLFLALDLGRLFHLVPKTFMFNSLAGTLTVTGLLLAIFIYGNIHYHHKVRQPLQLSSRGKVTKPVKVLLMSDLHLGYHNRRDEFARWVDLINAEKPDLILIAGDIIDISVDPLIRENVAEEWRKLKAPVYSCMGNHEYYANEPLARQFLADAGIHLLRDTSAIVGDLCIIGRDDATNRRRLPLDQLMTKADTTKFTILLDHQPYHLEQAEKAGIDFQFSGHTHHGQVWPLNWITDKMYECAFGAWTRSNTVYYVSSGMGIWGGKFRIGTRSEYVVATIGT